MTEKLKEDLEAEAQEVQEVRVQRPRRARLTAEESLKRMEAFPERREQFIASIRKSKSGGVRP